MEIFVITGLDIPAQQGSHMVSAVTGRSRRIRGECSDQQKGHRASGIGGSNSLPAV